MIFAPDKRVNEREVWAETILFSLDQITPKNILTAEVVDISITGMGLLTDIHLEKGQIIRFEKNQKQWELPDKAIIIWSFSHKKSYRAGLEFIL